MSATLRVTREGTGIELRRGTFDVLVDGGSVGSIERSGTLEVPIEVGHHTLRINAGRYTSRSQAFDVTDGETVNYRCHGAMMWPRYVLSALKPDFAISLHHES